MVIVMAILTVVLLVIVMVIVAVRVNVIIIAMVMVMVIAIVSTTNRNSTVIAHGLPALPCEFIMCQNLYIYICMACIRICSCICR